MVTVNVLKFRTPFYVGFQGWNSKMFVRIANREYLQKESDLGLRCVSRPILAGH